MSPDARERITRYGVFSTILWGGRVERENDMVFARITLTTGVGREQDRDNGSCVTGAHVNGRVPPSHPLEFRQPFRSLTLTFMTGETTTTSRMRIYLLPQHTAEALLTTEASRRHLMVSSRLAL